MASPSSALACLGSRDAINSLSSTREQAVSNVTSVTWASTEPAQTIVPSRHNVTFKLARSYAAEQMRIVQAGSEREDLQRVA